MNLAVNFAQGFQLWDMSIPYNIITNQSMRAAPYPLTSNEKRQGVIQSNSHGSSYRRSRLPTSRTF